MSAAELLPPELAVDEPPLSDDDLARYFDAAEADAAEASVDLSAALEWHADTPAGRWRIEADDQAEWAMRKLVMAQDELRVMIEQRDEYVARIDAWLDRVSRSSRRTVGYMTERLEDYAVRRREAGGSATLQLPSGSVKTTTSKPTADVDDDDELAAHLSTVVDSLENAAWTAALADAELTLADLVRVQAKVYVGPFRKLVHLAEQPVGSIITTTLRCGHTIVIRTNELDVTEGDYSVGEFAPCAACPPDPIDGPVSQPVASVDVEPDTELVVLGPDDEPVPGTVVKPGGITPKLVPGG